MYMEQPPYQSLTQRENHIKPANSELVGHRHVLTITAVPAFPKGLARAQHGQGRQGRAGQGRAGQSRAGQGRAGDRQDPSCRKLLSKIRGLHVKAL